jgi:hypothetical protein
MEIKIGEKYKVKKNRHTYFGSCDDIKALEGKVVTVKKVYEYSTKESSYGIEDEFGEGHTCEGCNLQELNNNLGEE